MKRIWTLYRVSTKGQVRPDEDIPMQRNAVTKFIMSHPDWKLENELYERGVSGWKNRTDDRDVLVEIKNAAENGEFDILVVFMFDRLGRREDETPLVVQYLIEHGVEVWSVKEGQAKLEEHTDLLINYIRFWQSSGESKKTSIRVKEVIEQMNENGDYTGSNPPIGYEVYDTGVKHWKYDKTIKDMGINQDEKTVVELIFDLYVNKGYGSPRITKYLNENGFRTRKGNAWRINTVFSILKNPIYIGQKRYNVKDKKDSRKNVHETEWKLAPVREDWIIVDVATFEKAQEILRDRREGTSKTPRSGKLLLNGIAVCGYCGNKLYSDFANGDYKLKDGTVKKRTIHRYRCLHARQSNIPHDRSLFTANKYEKTFEEDFLIQVRKRLNSLGSLTNKSKQNAKKEIEAVKKNRDKINKEIKSKQNELVTLNGEVVKSLTGKSAFKPEQLSLIIENTNEEIAKLEVQVVRMDEDIEKKVAKLNVEDENIVYLKQIDNEWENADFDRKKFLASQVLKEVIFTRDDVDFNFRAGYLNN